MTYGLQPQHEKLGHTLCSKTEGKTDLLGVCDRVEIQPGIFWDFETDTQTAREKIRFRLRPTLGRATWTPWYPHGTMDTPVEDELAVA